MLSTYCGPDTMLGTLATLSHLIFRSQCYTSLSPFYRYDNQVSEMLSLWPKIIA